MTLSRRNLLMNAPLVGAAIGGLALGGCSTTQIAAFESTWTQVVDTVQADVAAAAKFVPTVESIAATAASLFGPQWQGAVTAGTAVVNAIVTAITAAVTTLTPPASAALRARLRASSVSSPVAIGTTPQGVPVRGYRVSE